METEQITGPAPWDSDAAEHPFIKLQVKEIAGALFSRMVSGQYAFGTRIPAERELASEFNESRATIRQVLDFLEVYGLVTRRAGSGTFVTYRKPRKQPGNETREVSAFNIGAIAESTSPFEMNVAESILAPEMVRLATIYMSTRNLTELGTIMSAIETVVTDATEFARLENGFMMAIAEGTHNSLIVAMYRILHDVRRQTQLAGSMNRTLTPARIRESQRRLRSLYGALERRDVESAVEFIRLHIASSQDDMIYVS